MLTKPGARLLQLGLAALLVLGAVGCSNEPEPTSDQDARTDEGGQMDQQIPPKFMVGDVPQAILDVKTEVDYIYDTVQTTAREIPGYDDVLLADEENRAYLTGRDGWIWTMDLGTGEAKQLVDVPLMAAGIQRIPGNDDEVVITISRRGGASYPPGEQVGLYTLNLSTQEVTPLVVRVPHSDDVSEPTVFATADQERAKVASLDDTNSRPVALCNDAAVSADGKRVYFTESYVADGATMGGIASLRTLVMLPTTGRLWMYDMEKQTVGLVANGYSFTDGILIEGDGSGPEKSVLMTDNARFQLHRIHLAGDKAGESEPIWRDLPGLADGLRRDDQGRIWLSIITNRGTQLDWMHANPVVKPFMMEHPELISLPSMTSLLLLSPDASTPLWYTEHPQTRVTSIAAVTPGTSGIYLANFSDKTPGLHRIDSPLD